MTMNRTDNTWTPYPNAMCIIGSQLIIALNIPCCVISCILNTTIFIVLSFKVNFADLPILSLTIADLLTSYISQPLLIAVHIIQIVNESESPLSLKLQRVTFFLNCITCTASVFNMGFVVTTRFVQIKSPLRYQEITTKRRLLWGCTILWFIAISNSFVTWQTGISMYIYYLLMLSGLLLQLLLIGYINASIVLITRRIIRANGQSSPFSKKAVKTAVIMNIIFLITAFPFAIVGVIYFIKWPSVAWMYRSDYNCHSTQRNIYASAYFYSILLYHVNAACNPLIYALRDTRIKTALKKLLTRRVNAAT